MTTLKEQIKLYLSLPYLKRYFLYLLGIVFLSIGVALIYQTYFGASAWDALHYNFHIGIPIKFVYLNPLSAGILVILAYIIEWKKPSFKMIIPIILSMVFGFILDTLLLFIPSVKEMMLLWNVLYLATATSVIGVGLNIIRYCNFGLPGIDQFCLAIANRFGLRFGQGKFLGEVIAMLLTVIVGLFYGTQEEFFYLGFTTVFFILFLGTIVDLFRNTVFRTLKGIPNFNLFADDLTEEDIITENVIISSSALIEKNGKIMVIHLKDKDYYQLPNAKKIENERMEKALRREVYLQTGQKINLHEEELIINEYFMDFSNETHYFRAKLKNKKIIELTNNSENIDVLWMDKNELIDVFSNHETKDKFGPQIMWREFIAIINTN
ncbi:MAG: hypothetical protein JEZ05_04720 [Tenericutes bacterium]|nr:hypothetical protein [Mycoplasmatota bacterium]